VCPSLAQSGFETQLLDSHDDSPHWELGLANGVSDVISSGNSLAIQMLEIKPPEGMQANGAQSSVTKLASSIGVSDGWVVVQ
jgi:hypothetical protein